MNLGGMKMTGLIIPVGPNITFYRDFMHDALMNDC